MGLDFKDMSNSPPTLREVREAKAAVAKFMVIGRMQLPPELAVQLPSIHRCLDVLEAIMSVKKDP